VAVTYEPYLTLAMQQNPSVKMIYSAGENPGLISDVFVVRDEFLKEKPGQIVALLKAWDLALADYRKDTAGGRAIISEAVGAKPEELATAFDGVVYYSLAENKTELGGDFSSKVIPEVHAAARTAGILQKDVDLTAAIDSRFVDAATK
jgi:NitT/TauT family transport system substrate-binding protein